MLKKEKVGKTIALYRKRCGLKQKDLAEMLHVTYQSVSRWELGISLPSVDLLYGLSACINLSSLRIPPLYRFMAKLDMLNDKQLLWMFSLGVGFITAVSREQCRQALKIIRKHYPGYVIGKIKRDTGNSGDKVWTEGKIQW